MRVIKNNVNKSDFPKEIECEHCGSKLEILSEDLSIGYLGGYYVECPVCNEKSCVDEIDGILVNKDNIKFPDYFYYFGGNEAKILSDEEIEKYIKKGIEWFRKNPDNFCYATGTGDTSIVILNYSGDKEYCIQVARGYYETEIDYEKEDYDAQESIQWSFNNKGIKINNGKEHRT